MLTIRTCLALLTSVALTCKFFFLLVTILTRQGHSQRRRSLRGQLNRVCNYLLTKTSLKYTNVLNFRGEGLCQYTHARGVKSKHIWRVRPRPLLRECVFVWKWKHFLQIAFSSSVYTNALRKRNTDRIVEKRIRQLSECTAKTKTFSRVRVARDFCVDS